MGELENVSVGHGVSLLQWRSGGVEHPHDTPPYPFMPSPTFVHSSFARRRKRCILWHCVIHSLRNWRRKPRCGLTICRERDDASIRARRRSINLSGFTKSRYEEKHSYEKNDRDKNIFSQLIFHTSGPQCQVSNKNDAVAASARRSGARRSDGPSSGSVTPPVPCRVAAIEIDFAATSASASIRIRTIAFRARPASHPGCAH